MDDGFQNPSLAKDLSILVVDGRRGVGNGRVIPAGPLRAPLDVQLARAQAVVVVGPAHGAATVVGAARGLGLALFHAALEADRSSLAALGGRKVLAFAGIGDPEKFFATLADAGVAIGERVGFADHHRYSGADAQALLRRADADNLVLITTEKDRVRLGGDPALDALAARANVLPVRLVVEEQDAFRGAVLDTAKRR
jgi:tetraacyldisaccharide 4'-kinase